MNKVYYPIITLFFLSLSLFVSCDDTEKKAKEQLEYAHSLYEANDLNKAKIEVDNIRNFYPKKYKIIKKGNQLMRDIEIKEQERTLAYCDSIIQIRESQIDSAQQGFILEKDPEYDNLGNWVYKTQTIEKNIDKTYLRATVDELGFITISSIYRSGSPLKHTQIRVENKNGEYADSFIIEEDGANNYSFKDNSNGRYNEIVTFKRGKDNGIIKFINTYKDQAIKVTLIGKKKYTYTLDKADKEAIGKAYGLSFVLSDIEQMKKESKLATAKIEYLYKKKAEYEEKSE